MSGWFWILGIGGVVLVWLIAKWLYFDPVQSEFETFTRECLDRQAQKRNGTVSVSHGRPTLTVPHKAVSIEVSLISNDDDIASESTYARFRMDDFTGKELRIILNSKDLFLKPLVFGTRVNVSDARFSEKYIVVGNDATFVNALLTQEIRDKLCEHSLQVKFGRRTDSSRLSRDRGWLSVFTQGIRSGDEAFDQLIETAILFHERLEALKSQTGIGD